MSWCYSQDQEGQAPHDRQTCFDGNLLLVSLGDESKHVAEALILQLKQSCRHSLQSDMALLKFVPVQQAKSEPAGCSSVLHKTSHLNISYLKAV